MFNSYSVISLESRTRWYCCCRKSNHRRD